MFSRTNTILSLILSNAIKINQDKSDKDYCYSADDEEALWIEDEKDDDEDEFNY